MTNCISSPGRQAQPSKSGFPTGRRRAKVGGQQVRLGRHQASRRHANTMLATDRFSRRD